MKKYRIGYDRVFLAHPSIKINNEIIGALSIMIKYKIFYKNKEIFVNKDEERFANKNIEYLDIDNFLKCSIDGNEIKFKKKYEQNIESLGYTFEFEIAEYTKEIFEDGILYPKYITKEEFYKILTENVNNFNNTDNKIAQSTSYKTYEE